jgi:hypothetical protein
VQAWRTSTGRYFCNEFCAQDEGFSKSEEGIGFVDYALVFNCTRCWSVRAISA